MNTKLNYEVLRDNLIHTLPEGTKLLLHCCCGPCASPVIERLGDFFDITVYYYNPCIMDEGEYDKRRDTLKKLIDIINSGNGPYTTKYPIKYIDDTYDNDKYLDLVQGREQDAEGGARCNICFVQRLRATRDKANEMGFPYFCSTLTLSPHKDHLLINRIGEELSTDKTHWLPSDFKKNNGFLRSTELCKTMGLYRQDYCGCVFSKYDT